MRLRIVRQSTESIDGIRISDFIVGFVYDVGTILGSYLLAQGVAEPADDAPVALIPPVVDIRFAIVGSASALETPKDTSDTSVEEPRAEAADSSRRTRKPTSNR